jgi:hypothetical protein
MVVIINDADLNIVRPIQQVWTIPGLVKLIEQEGVIHVCLRREHPRARDVCQGLLPLLPEWHSLVVLG